jgi:hypothetical protein
MDYLLWTAIGWGAFSVLALPLFIRFGRCMARFDAPVEQIAAAAAAPAGSVLTDVLRNAGRRPGQAGRPARGPADARRMAHRRTDGPAGPSAR